MIEKGKTLITGQSRCTKKMIEEFRKVLKLMGSQGNQSRMQLKGLNFLARKVIFLRDGQEGSITKKYLIAHLDVI